MLLYDRGYTAFWLMALHNERGIHFCRRMRSAQERAALRFIESGQREAWIRIEPTAEQARACRSRGLSAEPIEVRLIRVDLSDEVEVLMTSLRDADRYGAEHFGALYHQRWAIEEYFKTLKQWGELENFSGKSVLSVYQDFHACILSLNLTAMVRLPAQRMADAKTAGLKHRYQINTAQALSRMKHELVRLLLVAHEQLTVRLRRLVERVSQLIEPIRAGRKAKRQMSGVNRRIHRMRYKPAR